MEFTYYIKSANTIFELYFPIWMLLVNVLIGVAFLIVCRIGMYRNPAMYLSGAALSYALLNLTYTILNWGHIYFIKMALIKFGRLLILTQICFGVLASLLSLIGTFLLIRTIMRYSNSQDSLH